VNVIRLQDILDSTGATLVRGPSAVEVHGVSTDTRTLTPQALFLALSGPNFDGNQFARRAGELGAGALLLRGRPKDAWPELAGLSPEVPVCVHESPRRALADLASWHRARLFCPVLGITGSSGKTTTKVLVAQLLSSQLRFVASPSSFNNDIGVPHSLLLADQGTQAVVLEIGTNHPGEIAALCRIARPTCGVITSIGASHLAGLGSVEAVAREKSELFACLPRDGFAVLNLDSPHAALLKSAAPCRVVSVSIEGAGEWNASEVVFHNAGTTFRLGRREITSPLLGTHNVTNLLLALAACQGLGVELERLLPHIGRLRGAPGRMEPFELAGLTLLDDSYNANPDSARAAVRVLAGTFARGRRVLVLGDMLELGPSAPELHHQLGCDAARAGIDRLVLVGDLTRATASGALEAGLGRSAVIHCDSAEAAIQCLGDLLAEGDVVLVKASRGMRLERVVRALVERHGKARP
jgi:UDP-N-acetylmuramoyl-tripeptide--D-alanyl-D-alanine ligase